MNKINKVEANKKAEPKEKEINVSSYLSMDNLA
jgi:hypothetical protein